MSSAQMMDLGLSRRQIQVRSDRGNLHRVHDGVYVVGARRLTRPGWLWAAVLAAGGPARTAISHVTAAVAWRMLGRWPARIDVATLGESHSTSKIFVHRTLTLDDLTHHNGLPITSPARTLIDNAAHTDLERMVHEAAFHGLLDDLDLDALVDRAPRRLATFLTSLTAAGPQRTKSELEVMLLALVDRHGLPRPLVNVPLHGYTVDFLWAAQRVVVETDGRNHLRPLVYEADRERDAHLQELGYRVYRVTGKQLDERPGHVARRLTRWLA